MGIITRRLSSVAGRGASKQMRATSKASQFMLAADSVENLLDDNSAPGSPQPPRAQQPKQQPLAHAPGTKYPTHPPAGGDGDANVETGMTNLSLGPAGAVKNSELQTQQSFGMTAERFVALESQLGDEKGKVVMKTLKELQQALGNTVLEELDIPAAVMSKMVTALCGVMRTLHPVVGLRATKVLTSLILQANISLDKAELISKTIQNMALSDFSKYPLYASATVNILCIFAARWGRGEQCVRECLSIINSILTLDTTKSEDKVTLMLAMACLTSTEMKKNNVAEYHEETFKRLASAQDKGNDPKFKVLSALVGAVTVERSKALGQTKDGRCDFYTAKCAVMIDGIEWEQAPELLLPTLDQYCRNGRIKPTTVKLPGATEKLGTVGAMARHVFWRHVLPSDEFDFVMGKQTHAYHVCYPKQVSASARPALLTQRSLPTGEGDDQLGVLRPKGIIARIKRRHSLGVKTKRR